MIFQGGAFRRRYDVAIRGDVAAQVEWLRGEGASAAAITAWLARLAAAIDGLADAPMRWPVDDAMTALVGVEIRRLVVGEHLVWFEVDLERRVVAILLVAHGARDPLRIARVLGDRRDRSV